MFLVFKLKYLFLEIFGPKLPFRIIFFVTPLRTFRLAYDTAGCRSLVMNMLLYDTFKYRKQVSKLIFQVLK